MSENAPGDAATTSRQILIVANRTAATPDLIEAVRRRAAAGDAAFTLLVPLLPGDADPEGEEASKTLSLAVPLLEQASGGRVEGALGDADPFAAVRALVGQRRVDEVIVSTLPPSVSAWLHERLPERLRDLGLEVTVVTAREPDREFWPTDLPIHGLP